MGCLGTNHRWWASPALLVTTALSCSTRPVSVEPRSMRSDPASASSAPEAPPPAAVHNGRPHWTFAEAPEIMAVRGQVLALQSNLNDIKFRGPAILVHEPSDVDETYLARREVDEMSLPTWVRENRANRVALLEQPSPATDVPVPGKLTSTLGTIGAYGLADESWTWSPRDARTPQTVFDKGHQFLGATLDVNEHSLLRWATFAPAAELHVWKVEQGSKEQEAVALVEVRKLASYRARHAEYRAFAASVETVASQVNKLRSKDPKARKATRMVSIRGVSSDLGVLEG
jgi:hypothetical protein